ncbi:MAG: hypothetical protein Ct9H300mP31_20250 [Acidimicrobiaceae bacterium]|nr:MAG: hypothetical protein Ct9H300mP31_20250 [Acidimicrobiaceae bacterium]
MTKPTDGQGTSAWPKVARDIGLRRWPNTSGRLPPYSFTYGTVGEVDALVRR